MKNFSTKNILLFSILSFIVGSIVSGWIIWSTMPGMMLSTHKSKFSSVEETCREITSSIEANGWKSPATRDMNKTVAKHGVEMDRRVSIVELCNATHAEDVLSTNPEVSTLMPCAWGVYEGDDEEIYITSLNMGLMSKMFGGKIAEVMGGPVAVDEKKILSHVITH